MNSIQIIDTFAIANQSVKQLHQGDHSLNGSEIRIILTPRQFLKYHASKNFDIHVFKSLSEEKNKLKSKSHLQSKKEDGIEPNNGIKKEGDLDNGQELEV